MGSIRRFDIANNIRKYALDNFVETGTWRGDGLAYASEFNFKQLFSVEIMSEIAESARKRFEKEKRIVIYTGSSTTLFPELLPTIKGNILFWLDAHYPGAEEGLKSYNEHSSDQERLPLETELELISNYRKEFSDLIIIDDLRIYEDGPFESGNLPLEINTHKNRSLAFIEKYFGKTHTVRRFYNNEGYIVIEPNQRIRNPSFIEGFINKKLRKKIY